MQFNIVVNVLRKYVYIFYSILLQEEREKRKEEREKSEERGNFKRGRENREKVRR